MYTTMKFSIQVLAFQLYTYISFTVHRLISKAISEKLCTFKGNLCEVIFTKKTTFECTLACPSVCLITKIEHQQSSHFPSVMLP